MSCLINISKHQPSVNAKKLLYTKQDFKKEQTYLLSVGVTYTVIPQV